MNLGAVIVTHNSGPLLARAVHSLWANNVIDIIVIDNASNDDTIRVARHLGINVITNYKNRGFAAGCNQGAKFLSHRHILFLNPDAWLPKETINRSLRTFSSLDCGAVGLALISPQGQPEKRDHGREVTLSHLFLRVLGRHKIQRQLSSSQANAVNVDWVCAGAMIVSRPVFNKVNGFDETFFMYWEDVDLCLRIKQAGFSVYYLPQVSVFHERGASLGSLDLKTKYYDTSADRYFRKHYATPIWIIQSITRRLYRLVSPHSH